MERFSGSLGRSGLGRVVVILLTAILVLLAGLTWRQSEAARARLLGYPPLTAEAGTHRLLPLPPPTASTSYAFLETEPDGTPVAYDACRPIHYVVGRHHLPAYGLVLVRQAVQEVSRATGLKFVEDGLTDEPLDFERPWSEPDRYGERWAPVLMAFSDARETPALGAEVMGLGGSRSVAPRGPSSRRYVSGTVGLDQDDFDRTLGDSNGFAVDRAAVMHELGHVVGLAHVPDNRQLMAARNNGLVGYGTGDLHGLALEGSGRCFHDT